MKTILVTGASSGIGWDTVRCLSENNFRVIATVRSKTDFDKLVSACPHNVIPVLVDLAQFDQIEMLPEKLRRDHQVMQLDGLVNNAGIAFAGPFLDQDFSEIESILRINVLSVLKMTQVMLPLLGAVANSKHAGTIINISSISGKSAAPFLSIYAASKHAIEGFSDALRKEMMLFGIQVVVVAPGSIKTAIWNKGFGQIKGRYVGSAYANAFQKFIRFALSEEKNALEVTQISSLIRDILAQKNPAYRYAPIPRKWINWYLPLILPQRFYNYLTAKTLGFHSKINLKK